MPRSSLAAIGVDAADQHAAGPRRITNHGASRTAGELSPGKRG
jgi:hypothetical protein